MADDEGTDDTGTDDEGTEDDDKYEAPDKDTWDKTNQRVTDLNAEAKKWRLRAQGKDEKWKTPTPAPPCGSRRRSCRRSTWECLPS